MAQPVLPRIDLPRGGFAGLRPALLCLLFAAIPAGQGARGADAPPPLDFEARVRAQEAIERVFDSKRIWPKENPGAKPPFETRMPRAALEAKVTDYLKKSTALETFWQHPVKPEDLQAEMDRMAKGTRDPETLKALFAALGNDPTLVAECLARPLLVDRLIHNWYSADSRFHAEARAAAKRVMDANPATLEGWPEGEYRRVRYRVEEETGTSPVRDEVLFDPEELDCIAESTAEPDRRRRREDDEAIVVEVVRTPDDACPDFEWLSFAKRPFDSWWKEAAFQISSAATEASSFKYRLPATASRDRSPTDAGAWGNGVIAFPGVPTARDGHTAVWTGTEMIIWGGDGGGSSGARYDPATDSWAPTSFGPSARSLHTAVWTGTEMIVWGGQKNTSLASGGRYRPESDSWTPTSTGIGAPVARHDHTAVWTGTEMIVWGGRSDSSQFLQSGGRYSPSSDSWNPTSTGPGVPSPRLWHTAVWTGSEMIVWGGWGGVIFDPVGGCYSPTVDQWRPTGSLPIVPMARYWHTAVWTGSEMIVWGGVGSNHLDLDDGGRYSPSGDVWKILPAGAGSPPPRSIHSAVWTGEEMIVWGGRNSGQYLSSGGRYRPTTDLWQTMSTGPNLPSPRGIHTASWCGNEMIVWGGWDGSDLDTGARYSPDTDSWIPTSIGSGAPAPRKGHTAVWTGAEMIVWGATPGSGPGTGGRYTLATDSWAKTSTSSPAPSNREWHTAVWTGSEMIVWGGDGGGSGGQSTGGRYRPDTDSWLPTSPGSDCPSPRQSHTAVWTGREMIVWGGYTIGANLQTGGAYSPDADSWRPTNTGSSCPPGRLFHTAVWTGDRMLVWGGYGSGNIFGSGAGYFPETDEWRPIPDGPCCPSGRYRHTAIWTGHEMIVWGGDDGLDTGARYDPTTDAWTRTSTSSDAPSPRHDHSAIWTGNEMIVWGGKDPFGNTNSGRRYAPLTDRWFPVPTTANCPSPRSSHSAIWTGEEMIVWGGADGSFFADGGRYQTPCSSFSPPPLSVSPFACEQSAGDNASVIDLGLGSSYSWTISNGTITAGNGTSQITYTAGTGSSVDLAVVVVDPNGCSGKVTASVPLLPAPAPPGISGGGNGCASVTLSAPSGYGSYQWLLNDIPIPGATSSSYLATVSGTYVVRGYGSNGCFADSSPVSVSVANPGPVGNTLRLRKSGTRLLFAWAPLPAADHYELWRTRQPVGQVPQLLGTVWGSSATFDTSLSSEPPGAFYLVQPYHGSCAGPIE